MKKRVVKSVLSLAMVAALTVTTVLPAAAGASTDPNASAEREAKNAAISEAAAEEGMVLLDNSEGVLPIAKSGTVALYGAGVYATVKGGTGSGDVYLKDGANIDVQQGFEDRGYVIVNKKFLAQKEKEYNAASSGSSSDMFSGSGVQDETAYKESDIAAAAAKTDTAIYVLSRNSGEGSDRTATKGDYYLTDNEAANLTLLGKEFENVIVVLNVGGIIDTNFYTGKYTENNRIKDTQYNRDKIDNLDALVLMSQAGQNGGYALVDILNGTSNPSGKLTDTWANEYEDYPSSASFSSNDGETLEELYTDDIYVGYRYFDTFGKDVAYPFGYGLSYSDFAINVTSVEADTSNVTVNATVTNKSEVSGKEVVEVYFSAPAGSIDKPYQELAAYQKVEVAGGASENVTITFATSDMSSYDEYLDAYVLEKGAYTIRVGNSSRNTVEAGTITLDQNVITEQCQNNLGLTKEEMENGTYEEGRVLHNTYVTEVGENGKENTIATAHYGTDKIEGMLDGDSEGYGKGITPSKDGVTADKVSTVIVSAADFGKPETHTYSNGTITTYVSGNADTDSAKYAKGKTSTSTETLKTLANIKDPSSVTLYDVMEGNEVKVIVKKDGKDVVEKQTVTIEDLVANMSNDELADLVEGGTWDGLASGNSEQSAVIGSQADSVYGAAGETTSNLYTSRYIPNIVMSDGPAGIRITNSYIQYTLLSGSEAYDANQTYYTATYSWSGNIYTAIELADEAAYKAELAKGTNLYVTDNVTYYQYCTAFPIGTLLAQTWDPEVVENVGRAIQEEMLEYGVTSFLAPGMNIHRNPLCGRNFEYYSEDPVIAGLTAAAETKGVETKADGSDSGVGVTLKHFAFNDQENSRTGSNSVVSERAAREIYLKGFEIAIKTAQPDYVMSSYNMVNGYSTFTNYGLLTEILRNEWEFEGFVMTDWYSVWGVQGKNTGKNVQGLLMYAGNDCEMPGSNEASLLTALSDNDIRLGDLQRSAINMLNVISRSAVYKTMAAKLTKAAEDEAEVENALESSEALKEKFDSLNKQIEELENASKDSESALKEAQAALEEAQAAAEKAEDAVKAAEDKAAEDVKAAEDKAEEAVKAAEEKAAADVKAAEEKAAAANKDLEAANKDLEAAKKSDADNAEALKKAQEELATTKAQLAAAQEPKAEKVTIKTNKASYSVKKGKTVKITATASDGSKVKFTSKNKKIAKVNAKGKITGVKKGTTKIVISAGSAKKTVKVTVK
jgi:beta-glucosidase